MRTNVLSAIFLATTALTPHTVFANEATVSEKITVQTIDQSAFMLDDLTEDEEKFRSHTTTEIEGMVRIGSNFVDSDLFRQIEGNGPVGIAEVTLALTPEFGLYAWSVQSLDIDTRVGDELFVGPYYILELSENTSVEVFLGYSFIRGYNNFLTAGAEVTHGAVDFSIMHFMVESKPRQDPGDSADATRIELGYSPELIEGVDTRFFLMGQTGFGSPDIVTTGVQINAHINEQWSIFGQATVRLYEGPGFDSKPAVTVGVTYRF